MNVQKDFRAMVSIAKTSMNVVYLIRVTLKEESYSVNKLYISGLFNSF